MALEFIGKDPDSQLGESPTVWVDAEPLELVLQGWKVDEATVIDCLKSGGIPEHETLIRVPLRMAQHLREALDKLEAERDVAGPASDARD